MADLNLALLIFLVVFLTQLVAWVGKSVLQELVRDAFHLVTEQDGERTGMDCAARTSGAGWTGVGKRHSVAVLVKQEDGSCRGSH